MNLIFALLAFIIGMATTVQGGVNSQLRVAIGNPFLAAIVSFSGGLTVLVLSFVLFNTYPLPSVETLRQVSWWKFIGGAFGSLYVLSVIFIVRDLGPANMLALAVAGQLIAAIVIDHYGWLGFSVQTVSPLRLLGVAFLVVGVYLILKN
ncbi:DMT family transporter [Salmonirosea aquatica]|uniref:EamA-like transporter family protein n=1 Tax=Salmonirosea aquatica TaxID=2654236 RepID=A0A7C9F990_9BACT|nr:EamA-like transporter family protein [Cytophagaceae bacterium SJW1-29]